MLASAALRDLAIIVVALESMFVFILLGVLIWQVWRLTKMIQTEIKPIIEDAQQTIDTMKATTVFVSDNVVQPVARAGGQVVAAKRTANVLLDDLFPGRRKV